MIKEINFKSWNIIFHHGNLEMILWNKPLTGTDIHFKENGYKKLSLFDATKIRSEWKSHTLLRNKHHDMYAVIMFPEREYELSKLSYEFEKFIKRMNPFLEKNPALHIIIVTQNYWQIAKEFEYCTQCDIIDPTRMTAYEFYDNKYYNAYDKRQKMVVFKKAALLNGDC